MSTTDQSDDDDDEDDESDKSRAIRRYYNGGDENDKSLDSRTCDNGQHERDDIIAKHKRHVASKKMLWPFPSTIWGNTLLFTEYF